MRALLFLLILAVLYAMGTLQQHGSDPHQSPAKVATLR